jgi:hypothetical protein
VPGQAEDAMAHVAKPALAFPRRKNMMALPNATLTEKRNFTKSIWRLLSSPLIT